MLLTESRDQSFQFVDGIVLGVQLLELRRMPA